MTFEQWLNEIEAFSSRLERLYEDLNDYQGDNIEIITQWLKAAYNVGYEAGNHNSSLESLRTQIEQLHTENELLRKGLDVYQRERDRYRHNNPEYTGSYFLAGGHGEFDSNCLPKFVRIVPAYGCAWEQVYVKTDETISYEGS